MTERCSADWAATAAADDSKAGVAVVNLQMLTIQRSENGFGFTLRRLPPKAVSNCAAATELVAFDVAAVKPGSNAAEAGLRAGDGIVSVDGIRVADKTLDQVVLQLQSCQGSTRLLVASNAIRQENSPAAEAVRTNMSAASAEDSARLGLKVTSIQSTATVQTSPVAAGFTSDLPPGNTAGTASLPAAVVPRDGIGEKSSKGHVIVTDSVQTAPSSALHSGCTVSPNRRAAAVEATVSTPAVAQVERDAGELWRPSLPSQSIPVSGLPSSSPAVDSKPTSPLLNVTPCASNAAKAGSPRRPQQLLLDWPPVPGGASSSASARSLGNSNGSSRVGAPARILAEPMAAGTATAAANAGLTAVHVPVTSPAAPLPAVLLSSRRGPFRPSGGGTVREMAAALEATPHSHPRPASVTSPTADCSMSIVAPGDAAVAANAALGSMAAGAASVEAPPIVTTTVTVAERSMETESNGADGDSNLVGGSYQLSAPRLPMRVLRAPVAVADRSGLSPTSPTGKCPEQLEQHSPTSARPVAAATAAEASFTAVTLQLPEARALSASATVAVVDPAETTAASSLSGDVLSCSASSSSSSSTKTCGDVVQTALPTSSSPAGVRFLPAYGSKPVAPGTTPESLASRITWQRKYNPGSGSQSQLDGGRLFTIRHAGAASVGTLGLPQAATVARSVSVRPSGGVSGGVVRGRSGMPAHASLQQPQPGAGAQTSEEATRPQVVIGRQQTVLGRRGSSGGSMRQPLQLVQQQRQQQQTCAADDAKESSDGNGSRTAQHAHRADQLGHSTVCKSAPNISFPLATTASADRLSDIDNETPPPAAAAAANVYRPPTVSDVVLHARLRLGSADDTLDSRGDGGERRGGRAVGADSDAASGRWRSSSPVPTASASLGSLVVATATSSSSSSVAVGRRRPSKASRSSGDDEAGSTSGSSSDNLLDDRLNVAAGSRPLVMSVPGEASIRSLALLPPRSPDRPWSETTAAGSDSRPEFRLSFRVSSSAVGAAALLVPAQQEQQLLLRDGGRIESIETAAAAAVSAASSVEGATALAGQSGADDEAGNDLPASLLTVGSSAGGDDLHSIGSAQSCDSVDSATAAGTRKESTSSADSLLRVPVATESVVRRRKSADVDVQAQLIRRTSYIIATSPGTSGQNASRNNSEALQTADKDHSTTDGAQVSLTPKSSKQKLKHTTDKVPTIKEGTEQEHTAVHIAAVNAADVTKEGLLTIKTDRLDGKRNTERSWKSFVVSIAGYRLFFTRDKKEHSSSIPSLTPLALEEVPVDLRGCKLDLALENPKKKNTLRLATRSGTELLLHAADIAEMMSWVRAILTAGASSEPADEPAKVAATVDAAIRRMEQQLAGAARSSTQPDGPSRTPSARKPSSAGVQYPWNRQPGAAKGGTNHDRGLLPKKDRKRGGGPGKLGSENDLNARNGVGDGGGEPARAFGIPLSECSPSHENEFVPLVVEQCTKAIEERGLEFTGLYRVPGNAAAVKTLRSELNRGIVDLENERWRDVNVVGSLLKQFFRKLPEPLVTAELYNDFITANHLPTHETKLRRIKELIHKLPEYNYETLKYLIRHLCKVASFGHVNKMEPRNLAICFGPTVIGCDSHSTEDTAKHMSDQCQIVESMILYNDWVFATPLDANEPVPPVCEDPSLAIPISETLQGIGDDLARITVGATGQRLISRGDMHKTRPSVSSEHSDGVASCDRTPDAAASHLQSPSPAESTGSTHAEEACGIGEPNSTGPTTLVAAAAAVESPILADAVLLTAAVPMTAAPGAAAPSPPPPVSSVAAVSPCPRRSGQGATVRSPIADNLPSYEAPPALPARRHGILVDSMAALVADRPSSPSSSSNSSNSTVQTMVVFADVVAATADRPPRPPRFGTGSTTASWSQSEVTEESASPGSDLSPVFGNLSLGTVSGFSRTLAQQHLGSGATVTPGSGTDRSNAPPQGRRAEEVSQSPGAMTTQNSGECTALKSPLARCASFGSSAMSCGSEKGTATVGEPSHRLSTSLSSLEEASDLMHAIAAELTHSDWRRLLHATESDENRTEGDGNREPDGRQSSLPAVVLSEHLGQRAAAAPQASPPTAAVSASLSRSAEAATVVVGHGTSQPPPPPSVMAASGAACYRDPTLHKSAGQQPSQTLSPAGGRNISLGVTYDYARLQLICAKRSSALVDSIAAATRLPATYADDSCVDSSDCSVSKRRMSDERKRLRRRHTLGGGDHFEKFRDGNVTASQSAAIRGVAVTHSKTSWELLQQPSPARPIELAPLPAVGLS